MQVCQSHRPKNAELVAAIGDQGFSVGMKHRPDLEFSNRSGQAEQFSARGGIADERALRVHQGHAGRVRAEHHEALRLTFVVEAEGRLLLKICADFRSFTKLRKS